MKALSIRQPWAWLILNAGKDVENRNWYTPFRGRFLIHASQGMTHEEYESAPPWIVDLPDFDQLQRGGIVGSVKLVDCVRESDSDWFYGGRWGFVLRDPKPLPFRPYRGSLGFFEVEVP